MIDHETQNLLRKANPVIRRQMLPSVFFSICSLAFVVSGVLATMSSNTMYEKNCWNIERHKTHVVVHIVSATTKQRFRVLLRTDTYASPGDTNTLVLTNSKSILQPRTISCGANGYCEDYFLVRMGHSNAAYRFGFYFGAQYLHDSISRQLGLDGELRMHSNALYFMDAYKICESSPDTSSEWLKSGRGNWFKIVATLLDYRYVINYCDLDSEQKQKLQLSPMDGCVDCLHAEHNVTLWHWMSYVSNNVHSEVDDTVSTTRINNLKLSSHSKNKCSRQTGEIYQAACLNKQALGMGFSCTDSNYVPFQPFSDMTLQMNFVNGVLYIRGQDELSLQRHNMVGSQEGRNSAITHAGIQLGIVLVAAAVVHVRKNELSNNKDQVFIGCMQALKTNNKEKIDNVLALEQQSILLSIISISIRIAVVAVDGASLFEAGLERTVVAQIVGTCFSFVHMCAIFFSFACLYNNKKKQEKSYSEKVRLLNIKRRSLVLGGSNAMNDVTNAILIVFSRPPIRVDVDLFHALARLLTVTLIMITSPSRCFFSGACGGFLGWSTQLVLRIVFSVVFWIVQSVTICISVVDLVILPTANDIMRGHVADPTWTALFIFSLTCVISIPRLTYNAVVIYKQCSEESCQIKG